MRIRTAIFGVYVLASAVGLVVLMALVLRDVRLRYVESMRRTLGDTAVYLAAYAPTGSGPGKGAFDITGARGGGAGRPCNGAATARYQQHLRGDGASHRAGELDPRRTHQKPPGRAREVPLGGRRVLPTEGRRRRPAGGPCWRGPSAWWRPTTLSGTWRNWGWSCTWDLEIA